MNQNGHARAGVLRVHMATVAAARSSKSLAGRRFSPEAGWKHFALQHAWVVPILVIAAWLRFSGVGGRFLYGDEAEYASTARYLARDWSYLAYPGIQSMVGQPFVSQPPLILYMMAISMRLFGENDFAAMLPSLLLGLATVLVVYATGHRLGGRFMGLCSAALLAVLPMHVELSRKAQLDAGFTFFLALTAYFCVAWLQERRARQAVGVGVAVACAALAKLPGMLAGFAVLVVFVVALAALLVRRAQGLSTSADVKRAFVHAGWAAIPIGVGAALYLLLLGYLQAVNNLLVKLQWQLGRVDSDRAQIQEMAAVSREWSWYFTDPHFSFQHLYGGVIVALAFVGLVVAVILYARRPGRETAHVVAPTFLLVLLAFFLYSERKEGFYLLPFAPFLALLVAYAADGLRRMLRWAGIRAAAVRPRAAAIAVALALLVVAYPTQVAAAESYERYVLGDDQEKYFGSGTREAALWIREHDPEAGQYGSLLGRFSLYWYNEQPTYHWYVDHTYIENEVQSGRLKYIVYDEYLQLSFDEEFMKDMIHKHNGHAVATFQQGWGKVTVFELSAG